MALDELEPQHGWMDRPAGCLAAENVAGGEEVALRLRHLFAFDHQEAGVHPEVREAIVARRSTRLRDLAFVMRKDEVFAAGVDVDHVPECALRAMTEHSMCQPG